MFLAGGILLVLTVLAQSIGTPAYGGEQLSGVILGRTGEILHVSVPQPIRKDAVFRVKLVEEDEPIAEARVLSCTEERPFIVLAKVVRGGIETPVPIGVHAYADVGSVSGPGVPRPMSRSGGDDVGDRFSLQAGAFYPAEAALRDSVGDFWQAYRLNYSFLRVEGFETLLSAEYTKGDGEFTSGESTVRRSMEVIPLTVLGRLKAMRLGSAHLFLGAGAGVYRIRSQEEAEGASTSSETEEFGHELALGLESRRGWTLELRYRDVRNTDIQGYSFALGTRF